MKRILTALCLVATSLLAAAQRAPAGTITVTTTAVPALTSPTCAEIEMDDLPGPDGYVSLREAICVANNTPGPDTINFAISGCPGTCTIQPPAGVPLPVLTDDGTTIDGYTQTGANPATGSSPAQLVIVLDGQNISSYWGITINSADNHIKGLVIHSFGYSGIGIGTTDATGNLITGNYIGTSANGYTDLGNDQHGVHIALGASNNTIGGDTPAERNLISGNTLDGVCIQGTNVNGNIVSGNYIGTDVTGNSNLPNVLRGVSILDSAQNNTIGGDTAAERNIIAGNTNRAVGIHGTGTNYNTVSGNYMNVGVDGTTRLPTQNSAVEISGGAQYNTIGGDTPGERNIISGSGTSGSAPGVYIFGAGTSHNTVSGNYIGTDAAGTGDLGNIGDGVRIADGASNNTIGGDALGEGNVISGNNTHGVYIDGEGSDGNIVSGNLIGLDYSGTIALGNSYTGIVISDGSDDNVIGGDTPGERNVISNNGGDGVNISSVGTSGNVISGNYIGLAADGVAPMGNDMAGIWIAVNAKDNLIGGENPGQGNIIANNGTRGVTVDTPTATGNFIHRNSIFDNNGAGNGIVLSNGANGELQFETPSIDSIDDPLVTVKGTAIGTSTVELFASPDADGEGRYFLGSTVTSGAGDFSFQFDFLPFPYLTVTSSYDYDGINLWDGTTMFSDVFAVGYRAHFLPLVSYP